MNRREFLAEHGSRILEFYTAPLWVLVTRGPARNSSPREITTEPPKPTAKTEVTPSAPAIIQREITRLQIRQSPSERNRWAANGYLRPPTSLPLTEENIRLAQARVTATFTLMEPSENPYFEEAALLFRTLLREETVSLSLYRELPAKDAMTTFLVEREGKLHFRLAIDVNVVLNVSTSTTLASQLTHEIEHMRNILSFLREVKQENPELTIGQLREKEAARRNDPTQRIEEEARGYGIQAQSYIHQIGLLGYIDSGKSSHEEKAVSFIQSGSRVDSQQWKDYIKKILEE